MGLEVAYPVCKPSRQVTVVKNTHLFCYFRRKPVVGPLLRKLCIPKTECVVQQK